MKANLSRMLRSGLAMLLVLCMVVGFIPSVVFANAGADNDIHYVSIGDSMTNGYCFDGYEQGNGDKIDFLNGVGVYGHDAYPNQFAAWLEGQGYDVEHTKLALSALRAEDLNYLLGGREEPTDGWQNQPNGYAEVYDDEVLKNFYQDAVKDADIITLGIGNASFGAYLMHRATDAMGVFGASLDGDEIVTLDDALALMEDAEDREMILDLYEKLWNKVEATLSAEMIEKYNLRTVLDLVAYTTAGFVINYKGVLEQIISLNPDAQIVLVGLMNTTYGMTITGENMEPFAIGDMMDDFFGALNTYVSGLPALKQAKGEWKEAKFYYADQPNPLFISQQFDDLYEANWGIVDRLNGEIVRDRTIESYNDSLAAMIGYAVTGAPLAKITLADVEAYEALDWEGLAAQWGGYWNPWGAFYFSGYISDQQRASDVILSVAIYLAIEEAVVESIDTTELELSGLMKIAGDLSSVFTGLGTPPTNAPEATREWLVNGLTTEEVQGMCKIFAMFKVGNGMSVHPTPAGHDEIAKSVIAAYEGKHFVQYELLGAIHNVLVDDSFISPAQKVAALEMLLDSLEPTKEVKTFKEIYAFLSSNSDYLSDEQTIAILVKIVDALRDDLSLSEAEVSGIVNFIFDMYMEKDNEAKKTIALGIFNILNANGYIMGYDALLSNVWQQWVDHYGADVQVTIEKLTKLVSERYAYYTESVLPAIEQEIAQLQSEKNKLVDELTVLNKLLAEKKAELEEVLAKQEIGSVTTPDINIDVEFGNVSNVPDNDCNVEGETSKEELEAAIADLEHAIAVLTALITDIEHDVDTMIDLAGQIAETVKALGKTMNEIAAAAKDVKDAIEAVVDVMTNESAEAAGEQAASAVKAAIAAVTRAAKVLDLSAETAGMLIGDIDEMLSILIADGEELYNKILADLPLVIENAPLEIKLTLAAVAMVAQEKGWTLEMAEAMIEEKLAAIRAEYAPKIAAAEAAASAMEAKMKAEIAARYAVVEAALKAEANAKIAALELKKAALEAQLNGYKAELESLPANAAQAIRDRIQAQIDRITGDLETVDADIAHAAEHLEKALKLAYAEIVADVNAKYEAALEALKKEIADLKAELEAAMGKSLDELLDMGAEGIAQILEALKSYIEMKAEEAIIALTNKMVEMFNMMLYNATHGEVQTGLNFKYVALGDGTNDYAELLAGKLSAHAWGEMKFVNAAKPGNTVSDVAANLPADVVGADVITLGFSQTEIVGRALAAYLAGESVDWNELVGEEAIPYVEKIMAYVNAEIDALELDEKVSTVLKHITEAYAYGVVEYAINLPALIKNIREVNPTAEIVILGMYNPLENISINVQGIIELDLSEYAGIFDYLIDGVYAYGVGLSVIAQDVTYVDAREVEVEKSALGLKELDALLKGDISTLYPSTESDAYIADRIYNSLVFTVKGDANGDGKVDSYDAALIARYDIGLIGAENLNLAVCDINGDGIVDSYDATLVARYDVGLLAA